MKAMGGIAYSLADSASAGKWIDNVRLLNNLRGKMFTVKYDLRRIAYLNRKRAGGWQAGLYPNIALVCQQHDCFAS